MKAPFLPQGQKNDGFFIKLFYNPLILNKSFYPKTPAKFAFLNLCFV